MSAPEYVGSRPGNAAPLPEIMADTMPIVTPLADLEHRVGQTEIVPHNRVVIGFEVVNHVERTVYQDMTYRQDLLVHEVRKVCPVAARIFPNHLLRVLEGSLVLPVLHVDDTGERREGVTTMLTRNYFQRKAGETLVHFADGVEAIHTRPC